MFGSSRKYSSNFQFWKLSPPSLSPYLSRLLSPPSLPLSFPIANDNAIYSSIKNVNIVINRLRYDLEIISEWFYEKYIVLNTDECHLLTLGLNELFSDFLSGILHGCFKDITKILQLKMLPRKRYWDSNW